MAHGDDSGCPGEVSHTERISRHIHDARNLPKTVAKVPRQSQETLPRIYGDQVLHGQWDNSYGEAYDSDESSYNGDSGQEVYHNCRRQENAAAETNQNLVARTEYWPLVQFPGNSESGTIVSQTFRVRLGRELEDGRHPFPVLNDDIHADFVRP